MARHIGGEVTGARGSGSGSRSLARASLAAVCVTGFLGAARPSLAQDTAVNVRLTVRPHAMALATRTTRSGIFRLNLPTRNLVYVPPQCVGTRRCPLIVNSNAPLEFPFAVADRYGIVDLELGDLIGESDMGPAQAAPIDRAIKEVLRTIAIDPDRIAIVGRCATGVATATYGGQNQDVFSRVVVFTQHTGDPLVRAPNQTTEYYIAGGLVEGGANFEGVRMLRERGYPVKYTMQFRGHTHQHEDYEFMAHWLQESWAIPDPAKRPAPYALGDPPPLTSEVIAQLDTFWTRFLQEPDSIRTTGRRALVREVVVPVGPEHVSTLMVDMAALAARYPSVAADLKAAGLTAQQHDAYRAALASARIVNANAASGYFAKVPVEPTSVLAQNVEFMRTHPDEFPPQNAGVAGKTPGITAMWSMP